MDRIEKKLREAQFFLDKMIREEDRSTGDGEAFDFYHSAFLNAGRTVDYWLRCDFKTDYPPWREEWNERNPAEARLIKLMADDRAAEVHGKGSRREVGEQSREFGIGDHRLSDSLISVSGPPGMAPVGLTRPAYSYPLIDGRLVAKVGGEYIEHLGRLVKEFAAR